VTRQPELIYGLGNLIENAAEFAKSTVWVHATYSAQQVIVEIADDGEGFAADILTHLGEPYTSSRRSKFGRDETGDFGLGLGFFIARTLIQRSGGKISARNLKVTEMINGQMPGGACVRLVWPRDSLLV
jgi:two-component system sensor histidine kinase RegB